MLRRFSVLRPANRGLLKISNISVRHASKFIPLRKENNVIREPTLLMQAVGNPLLLYFVLFASAITILFDRYFGMALADAASRITRMSYNACIISMYYSLIDYITWNGSAVDKVLARCRCHEVASERIREYILGFTGIYVKMGQLVACMPQIFPLEWCINMKPCLDNGLGMSIHDLRRAIEAKRPFGLGEILNDVFDDFNITSVKAASLAEVHQARHKDTGERLAVKVQYINLPTQVCFPFIIITFLSEKLFL